MQLVPVLRVIWLLLPSVVITSCSMPETPRGYVSKEWCGAMRELAINCLFPPREDVMVGDIYIAPASPESEEKILEEHGYVPLGLWLSTVKLSKELQAFYSSRPSFPTTHFESVTLTASTDGGTHNSWQSSDPNGNAFSSSDISRLRMVGFPAFLSATFTKGDLSALIPVEAVNLGLGAAYAAEKVATLRVAAAESYGLPAVIVARKICDDPQLLGLTPNTLRQMAPRNQLEEEKGRTPSIVHLDAITEVFYARAIEISIQSKKDLGARASAGLLVPPKGSVGSGSDPTPTTNKPEESANGTADVSSIEQRVHKLDQALNSSSLSIPGVTTKILSVSESAVSMRRIYERPIAIGFRSIHFAIDLSKDLSCPEQIAGAGDSKGIGREGGETGGKRPAE